eukprot:TRINITY_DN18339_c0_g1_i1.p1 TRINITY_DN18339_c0_g1~~TRINITY_DN18339_c0_g1_i1.p1  ORF type:complete len:563 (-),score=143.80 TRINITY_DN18339_c0_g1_i1:145-1833(-)
MSNKKEVKQVRYYCDYCKKDITRLVRVRCAECSDLDLCMECFSVGVQLGDHRNSHDYFLIDTLYFPVIEESWAASEELLLLEAIETHGVGNWIDISDHFGTKTAKECEAHFFSKYIDTQTYPDPAINSSFTEDELVQHTEANAARIRATGRIKRPSIPKVSQSNPVNHDLSGWMPKRREFETEYLNEAEVLIADISFDEDDDIPAGRDLKLKLLEYYNAKLDQRVRLRKFVVDNELIDPKKRQQRERRKTKEEKDMYMFARPFLQLSNIEHHEEFLKGLSHEQALRARIEELQECRRLGITTMSEVDRYEGERKKREQELTLRKARESASYLFPERSSSRSSKWLKRDREEAMKLGDTKGRSSRKMGQPLNISDSPGVELLSEAEQQLCSQVRVYPTQYMSIKETLLREDARAGHMLLKSAARQHIKIDVNKTGRIFDFFEQCGWVNVRGSAKAAAAAKESSGTGDGVVQRHVLESGVIRPVGTSALVQGGLAAGLKMGGGQGLAQSLRQQSVMGTLSGVGRPADATHQTLSLAQAQAQARAQAAAAAGQKGSTSGSAMDVG